MNNVPGEDTINDNHLVYQEINTSDANLVYANNSMNKIQKQKKCTFYISKYLFTYAFFQNWF